MRPFLFLLAPLLSIGVFYLFGWMAIVGVMLLTTCVIAFSSKQVPNSPSQTEDSTLSTYGAATTRVADI